MFSTLLPSLFKISIFSITLPINLQVASTSTVSSFSQPFPTNFQGGNYSVENITAVSNSLNISYWDAVGSVITFTNVFASYANRINCFNNTSIRGSVHYFQCSNNNKIVNSLFSWNKVNGAIFSLSSTLEVENCQVFNTEPAPVSGSLGYGVGYYTSRGSITKSSISGIKTS